MLCGLFCEAICYMSYLVPFCSCVFFSPFSIANTSFGEERANLSAFHMFDRFVLVWICRFPLPLDVWEGLRFVIVALPGVFSYISWVVTCVRMFLEGRPVIRFLAHLSQRLKVSYCDHPPSVVVVVGGGVGVVVVVRLSVHNL